MNESTSKSNNQRIDQLKSLADFLDTQFTGPFGVRFGWDGTIGLIPVVGDIVTSFMSFLIIARALLDGAPVSVLLRMGLNVLIDNLVDTVPLVGPIADFFWRSNSKNVDLLKNFKKDPKQVQKHSRTFILAGLVALILSFAGIIVSTVLIFNFIAEWTSQLIPH